MDASRMKWSFRGLLIMHEAQCSFRRILRGTTAKDRRRNDYGLVRARLGNNDIRFPMNIPFARRRRFHLAPTVIDEIVGFSVPRTDRFRDGPRSVQLDSLSRRRKKRRTAARAAQAGKTKQTDRARAAPSGHDRTESRPMRLFTVIHPFASRSRRRKRIAAPSAWDSRFPTPRTE